MPRSRETNPWLRYLEWYRVEHGRMFRWRPRRLVQAASRDWRAMTLDEKRVATRLPANEQPVAVRQLAQQVIIPYQPIQQRQALTGPQIIKQEPQKTRQTDEPAIVIAVVKPEPVHQKATEGEAFERDHAEI